MERKSHMPYLSLLLHLLCKVPQIKVIKDLCPVLSEIMKKIIIEISRSRLLKGCLELVYSLLPCLTAYPCSKLCCYGKTLSRIPFNKRLTHSVLASGICPCRIKVCKTGIHEHIHHLFCLFDVNDILLSFDPGESHHAESKFLCSFSKIFLCHEFLLPTFNKLRCPCVFLPSDDFHIHICSRSSYHHDR